MSLKLEKWEHPKGSGIKIYPRENRKRRERFGISYRVKIPAKLTGTTQKERQFNSPEKAEAWADKEYSGARAQGELYFSASPKERNDFIDVLPSIRKAGLSLREIVDYALPRMTVETQTFGSVIDKMRSEKEALMERGDLREHTIRSFKSQSGKILDAFSDFEIKNLTKEDIINWLTIDLCDLKRRTLKNNLACLNEVLSYSVAQGYVFENVIDRLTKYERRTLLGATIETQPEILTIDEVTKLLNTARDHPELNLLASIVLGLFCGIRTEELQKLRWSDINLDENYVQVGANIAKKRRIRIVSLAENAKRWLSLCNHNNDDLISLHASAYRNRFENLLRFAGFVEGEDKKHSNGQLRVKWKRNALRHSFGSYHYALHGDSILTAKELGQSGSRRD